MQKLTASNINVLPRNMWINCQKKNETPSAQNTTTDPANNTTALIVSVISKYFPELETYPENKFIRFQEEIAKILRKRSN